MLVFECVRPPGSCANSLGDPALSWCGTSMIWARASMFIFHLVWIPDHKLTCFVPCPHGVRQPFTILSVPRQRPRILNGPPCARQTEKHKEATGWIPTKCQPLSCWDGWSAGAGFNILWSAICHDPCDVLTEGFVAAIFHNPCAKAPCMTSKCVSPHYSFGVWFIQLLICCVSSIKT